MTQEVETAVVELEIVSCQTCDLVFVASERRSTCPSCGGEGTGPYLEYVLDESGLHPKNGPVVAAADSEPMMRGPVADKLPIAGAMLAGFLTGEEVNADMMKDWLLELGAKPGVAVKTMQRLTAVRDTIAQLATAAAEEPAEAEVEAEPTGESPPEDVPAAQAEEEAPPTTAEAPEAEGESAT